MKADKCRSFRFRKENSEFIFCWYFYALVLIQINLFVPYFAHNKIIIRPGGTRYRSWLRHYATGRKVAGSSPDEMDCFNLPNPSSRIMALVSTQPLAEMSIRDLPGG
jgi:hypothetical protein